MPNHIRSIFRLTALAGSVALAGCASVANVPPGTPYMDVAKQFGNPAVSCQQSNGSTRMIWSEEPSGEQAWATSVGANKLVGPFTQVLQPGVFDKLQSGTWTSAQVRCEFGPPAKAQRFPDKPGRITWEYRYMGAGAEYDMLYITFDEATNNMTGYSTGPDPELNPQVIGGN